MLVSGSRETWIGKLVGGWRSKRRQNRRRKKGRENELGELQLGVHVGSSGEEQEEEEEERGKFRNKLGRHAAST